MAIWTQTENCPIDLPGTFTSSGAEETFALGKSLALQLEKGSIVALKGPLGAGKTCFAKGIAKGLKVEEEVTSPTYTIISEYEGVLSGDKAREGAGAKTGENIPVYHIDAYRLRGNDDFSAIGGEEIVFGKGISLIEWSDHIPAFIPPGAFKVDIDINEDGNRLIRIYREAE